MKESQFDPFESIVKITAGAGYLYKRLQGKDLIKLRQVQDIFLDKLLVDTDPMFNVREANKIMVLKDGT